MTTQSDQGFGSEIEQASRLLHDALEGLPSPLNELVRAEAANASPPVRIGLVLAIGVGRPDTSLLRQQRIYLAAALEMLYIALQVHKLLFIQSESEPDDELDKSLVGSTILAGDYCFSRSAQLAAQTNNPRAVDIFAGALRDVSEAHLRDIFGEQTAQADDTEHLFRSGILAVGELTGCTGQQLQAALTCGTELAAALRSGRDQAGLTNIQLRSCAEQLDEPQRVRWGQMLHWLAEADAPST